MNNCIVCNSDNFKIKYNALLKQCLICDFITANIDLSANFEKLYNSNYFTGGEYDNYIQDKDIIAYNFKKRIKEIKKISKNNNIENVLEIGCAYGFFGEEFMKIFPNAKYKGIDVSCDAVETGRKITKIPLECADYLSYKTENKYSDVFLWDVIEHLPNPQLFVKKIADELIDGGRIHITTGDIGSFLPKIRKSKWRMIHPPTHLHYFSKKTITKLLNNHGFIVEKYSYPAVYRSLKQIFFSLFILNKKNNNLAKSIYKIIPNKIYIKINTFDIIYIVGKKTS